MSARLDHGEDSLAEMHEINVTPFIDVMLVLLIIFMVAAPLATVDISVNLPTSSAEPQARKTSSGPSSGTLPTIIVTPEILFTVPPFPMA